MVIIKLLLFLLFSFLLSRIILPKKELNNINSIPIHLFIGIILITYVYYLCKFFSWPIILVYSVLVIVLIVGLYKRKEISFSIEKISIKKDLFFLIIIYFTVSLPIIIQSFYMFGGLYPKIIYNVDSAYFLQFVHGFIESKSYPPEFKLSVNEGFNYHYGSMASAAMISEITGLRPHNSFLVLLPILSVFALISITLEIIRHFVSKNSYLIVAIVLLGFTQYGLNYFNISNVLKTIFTQEQFFYTQFTQIPTAFGINICLLIVFATLKFNQNGFKVILIFLLGLIAIFKVPFAPVIGMGFGLYGIFQLLFEKKITALIFALIGGMFMLLNYQLFVSNPSIAPDIKFLLMGLTNTILFSMLIFSLFLFATYLFFGSIYEEFKKHMVFLFFIVPGFLLGSIVSISHRDAFQLVSILPLLFCIFVVLIFFSKYNPIISLWKKLVFIAAIIFLTIPCFLVTTNFILKILKDPKCGHEYCNNESIAEALQKIPVSHSIIATNDLRYPANNNIRDNKQFQISALFGHRAFNAEMSYTEEMLSNLVERKKITELLKNEYWDQQQIKIITTKNEITHILIHKSYPHSQSIPLSIVFENRDYIVYKVPQND